MTDNYGVSQMVTYEGLSHIRKRPSVYAGDISNPNHILLEILANSLDEAMNGYGKEILISINGKTLKVEDYGRGIPIGMRDDGKSALEAAASVINTGGKFDTSAFSNSLGTNGQGLKICNALSEFLTITTIRNNKYEEIKFSRGEVLTKKEGTIKRADGVIVEFIPDKEIFKTSDEIDIAAFRNIVKQMSFLTKGVKYIFIVNGKEESFFSENGLKDFMKELCKSKEIIKNQFYCCDTDGKMTLEACMTYTSSYSDTVKLFANNGENISGTHLTEFRTILTRELNKYAREQNFLKEKDENLTGVDLQEGQVLILNIKAPDMLYEGQTKTKVTSTDIKPFIRSVVTEALRNYMIFNPNDIKAIVDKALESKKARLAAKNAREKVRKPAGKKGLRAKMEIIDKLTECDSKDRAKCELLITEGDSASGSAKMARNTDYQAVIGLRGKVLNSNRAEFEKLLDNKEVNNIITAIGAGFGKDFDVTKSRYGKIILLTDSDDDGSHIQILLLTLFFTYMRDLIEKGMVYVATPPLYRAAKGIKYTYLQTDKELEEYKKKNSNFTLQRFKGLGEMNPNQLKETTLDMDNRILRQIVISDFESSSNLIEKLMGKSAESRRDFLAENGHKVNLFF